jgi:hypothetical protein
MEGKNWNALPACNAASAGQEDKITPKVKTLNPATFYPF